MRWRWCLAAPVQHGRHLRAVCPGGTGMSYFDKLGDKLRHLHIVDSEGPVTHITFPAKAKCRCGS